MAVWAIADLHLSFGVAGKEMDVFGEQWKDHPKKIEAAWRACVKEQDLVLVAGDISWGKKLEEARSDLEWLGALPGTKVLIKGNHDPWCESASRARQILPPSCRLIHNDSIVWNGIAIGGTRLWDIPGISFESVIDFQVFSCVKQKTVDPEETEKVYLRELQRLEMSLKSMDSLASYKIAITHYPPIGPFLEETDVSRCFERHGIQQAVFGHLHHVKRDRPLFGTLNGVTYRLVAADFLDNFTPVLLLD